MNKKNPIVAELLWDHLLSREPEQIRDIYQQLSKTEQSAIYKHLQRMTIEEGWHDEQRISAQIALITISKLMGK